MGCKQSSLRRQIRENKINEMLEKFKKECLESTSYKDMYDHYPIDKMSKYFSNHIFYNDNVRKIYRVQRNNTLNMYYYVTLLNESLNVYGIYLLNETGYKNYMLEYNASISNTLREYRLIAY